MAKPKSGGGSAWTHHSEVARQQRQKWVPTLLKVAGLLVIGSYVLFMLSVTQQSHEGTAGASASESGSFARAGAGKGQGKTIAYAISVTADGPYMDGAAVLAHGIRKASADSKYGMELIAMVHPNVTTSRKALSRAGWKLLERDIPVDITTIKGKYLREHIAKNGCCGATELLKLYAWLLTDYHRVVHLDMDSMVVQPMDELYDMEGKDFLYTCDYGMMTKGSKACPVQGGFFVLRPNEADYQGLLATVKEGDFREGSAWGGEGIGWFWGGMTIQGLLPYYFLRIADPTRSLEVDRCVYNNMFDNPDCKNATIPSVKNVHFTVCQKPWSCYKHDRNVACTPFLEKWYELRNELEDLETGAHEDSCEGGRYRPLAFLQTEHHQSIATDAAAGATTAKAKP